MNRRQFVRNAGLAGVGLTAMGALAACGGGDSATTAAAVTTEAETTTAVEVPAYQGSLRILGIGADTIDPIKAAFEAATPGVTIEFTNKSAPEMTQLGMIQPDSFDILSGYYHMFDAGEDRGAVFDDAALEFHERGYAAAPSPGDPFVEGFGGPFHNMEGNSTPHRVGASLGHDSSNPGRSICGNMGDLVGSLRTERVEERGQGGFVLARGRPDQPTTVVVDNKSPNTCGHACRRSHQSRSASGRRTGHRPSPCHPRLG